MQSRPGEIVAPSTDSNEAKSEELSTLRAKMPEVLEYLISNIDMRASSEVGWHSQFALHVVEHFGLPSDLIGTLWRSSHQLALERYGELYPTFNNTINNTASGDGMG